MEVVELGELTVAAMIELPDEASTVADEGEEREEVVVVRA